MQKVRIATAAIAMLLVFGLSAQASGVDSALLRSLVIPGSGQAQRGHYLRAVAFAGFAGAGGVGLFITQIHYDRSVEKYNSEKAIYLDLARKVDSGELVKFDDIQNTYEAMTDSYDQAKSRYEWRNAFLGTLIGAYALNVVDMLLSPEKQGEAVSVEVEADRVRLVKTINF
jgi:hypothetical protein